MNYDLIKKLICIEESLSPAGFLFRETSVYKIVTFYKIDFHEKRTPEVTEYIKTDKELHVKFFSQVVQFFYHNGFAKALIVI